MTLPKHPAAEPRMGQERADCINLAACRRLALWPRKWGFSAEWEGCKEGCGLYQKVQEDVNE